MNLSQPWICLESWFRSAQGKAVGQAFLEELQTYDIQCMGETGIQWGEGGLSPWRIQFKYDHFYTVSPVLSLKADAYMEFEHIALGRRSIDCAVLPLTLDRYPRLHGSHGLLLDAIDNAMKSMGYIVIFGVNPWSLWGLGLRTGFMSCFGNGEYRGQSVWSLQRMMHHRGYRQCHLSYFYYIPPVTTAIWIRRFEYMEEVAKLAPIYPAGFYCMVFQKYDKAFIGPKLVQPRWAVCTV